MLLGIWVVHCPGLLSCFNYSNCLDGNAVLETFALAVDDARGKDVASDIVSLGGFNDCVVRPNRLRASMSVKIFYRHELRATGIDDWLVLTLKTITALNFESSISTKGNVPPREIHSLLSASSAVRTNRGPYRELADR